MNVQVAEIPPFRPTINLRACALYFQLIRQSQTDVVTAFSVHLFRIDHFFDSSLLTLLCSWFSQYLIVVKGWSVPGHRCSSLGCATGVSDGTPRVVAVDSGLKPALVYDTNSAGPEQVQRYLGKLRALNLVTNALRIVTINDNVLIVNIDLIIVHLEEVLLKKNIAVIDVSKSRAQPALATVDSSGIEESIQGILGILRTLERDSLVVPAVGEQLCAGWNLCSLYGVLLGFPVTYWFDQNSFENCLSMVPLVVTTVRASWDTVVSGYGHAFSSFSIPQLLISETQSLSDTWTEKLQERFGEQSAFSAFTVSTETVNLPSVSL
ncbi:hypothetical protein SKAU_G00094720 [Synaphobranchus kaupii]|uniref:Uncharacterized protein n=1 Tax=Synaphobranchus kaupii TaxID=118154 RepID=A0A9Q1FX36_SYNKA|nr:hypothetical protein SKAU_G00094720 [Synaphobranchus kaupii]